MLATVLSDFTISSYWLPERLREVNIIHTCFSYTPRYSLHTPNLSGVNTIHTLAETSLPSERRRLKVYLWQSSRREMLALITPTAISGKLILTKVNIRYAKYRTLRE